MIESIRRAHVVQRLCRRRQWAPRPVLRSTHGCLQLRRGDFGHGSGGRRGGDERLQVRTQAGGSRQSSRGRRQLHAPRHHSFQGPAPLGEADHRVQHQPDVPPDRRAALVLLPRRAEERRPGDLQAGRLAYRLLRAQSHRHVHRHRQLRRRTHRRSGDAERRGGAPGRRPVRDRHRLAPVSSFGHQFQPPAGLRQRHHPVPEPHPAPADHLRSRGDRLRIRVDLQRPGRAGGPDRYARPVAQLPR